MNWYYAEQGHQTGPVDDAQLDELVNSGVLSSSSLVWTEGMVDWKPYAITRSASPAPTFHFAVQPGTGCVCCGRAVAPHEATFISGRIVCPDCQPVYIERLREGDLATLPGALPYSGFWMRFVARMADYSLLMMVETLFTVSIVAWMIARGKVGASTEPLAALGLTTLAGFVISCTYESYFLATRGATPGKILCYMKVVTPDGSKIDTGTAIGRYFARLLSELTMTIGMLMAAFDREKRSLHDRIVGTRVIDVLPGTSQTSLANPTLYPVSRAVCCSACQTSIPLESWNGFEPLPCPGCGTPVQAIVFPAITRSIVSPVPEPVTGEGEASCYYHAGNRAKAACEDCGRFLCSVCDLDAGLRHLCPACFTTRMRSGQSPEFVQSVRLYDSIALTVALLPNVVVVLIMMTLLTAPGVIGFTLWNWKKPTSVTPRNKWRFVVAMVVAALDIVIIFGSLAAAVLSSVRGRL